MVSDGTGVYEIPDLSPGLYKVRFGVWDGSVKLVAYWWYTNPIPKDAPAASRYVVSAATRYEDGDTVAVVGGTATILDPCLNPLLGGMFKGTVSSSVPGFDPTCVNLMAFEAGSGIGIGIVNPVNANGRYRHHDELPHGRYKALAFAGSGAHCPDPPTFMDQRSAPDPRPQGWGPSASQAILATWMS